MATQRRRPSEIRCRVRTTIDKRTALQHAHTSTQVAFKAYAEQEHRPVPPDELKHRLHRRRYVMRPTHTIEANKRIFSGISKLYRSAADAGCRGVAATGTAHFNQVCRRLAISGTECARFNATLDLNFGVFRWSLSRDAHVPDTSDPSGQVAPPAWLIQPDRLSILTRYARSC